MDGFLFILDCQKGADQCDLRLFVYNSGFELSFTDLHSSFPFWGISDLECDSVTFVQFAERDSLEFVGVEEQVFCLALGHDKPEVLVGQLLDSSVHKRKKYKPAN